MEQEKKESAQFPENTSLKDAKVEERYRQQVAEAYQYLRFSGFDRGDLSLAEIPLEAIFVRLTLSVERRIQQIPPPAALHGTR